MIKSDSTWLEITHDPLEIQKIHDFVLSDDCGAVNIFVGTVRNYFDERKVIRMDYHGYPDMAENILENIVATAKLKWPIQKVAVLHRLGLLELREASIIIAVATGHRAESYEACRFIIEEIKKDLPVWKKEFYEDESGSWKII